MSSNPNGGMIPPSGSATLHQGPNTTGGQHKKRNSLDSQLAAHKLHVPQGFPAAVNFHH